MITTVTPNPSIDRAFDVEVLHVGDVQRAHASHVDAGGKGINVSRGLHAHGVVTSAVLPCGGRDGQALLSMLADGGIVTSPVWVAGETRTNITLVESTGVTTKINAPGPQLGEADVAALLAAATSSLQEGDLVVGAGSLPAGTSPDFYVRLGLAVREQGAELVLDTSGAPLAHAVEAGGLALIKPNEEELGELVGRELTTVAQVTDAARDVIGAGTREVLVSLGAHGALLVTATNVWWAGGPALTPASTVGAGDMTLAGYLSVPGHATPDRLRTAVAWGRAAVLLPGTAVPTPDVIDTALVRCVAEPDPSTPLKEL